MRDSWRWRSVLLFAAAMAWVEAAVVFYLRTLVQRLEPHQVNPLPEVPGIGPAELVREVATLIMLGAVGWLAGRTARSRFGYACAAFGTWDILYYVFLYGLTGWPRSLWDWDILFLLPLPWWGPVLAPVLIALLLVAGGGVLARWDTAERPLWPRWSSLVAAGVGAFLALGVFMKDAFLALPRGESAVRQVLPESFPWGTFLLALGLMAWPVVDLALQVTRGRHPPGALEGQFDSR